MKKKVEFLICGAQKGGTSALHSYLKQHPCVHMAKGKELHFFDNELKFKQNDTSNFYAEYHARFEPKDPRAICGEATPIYMYWYNCPKRIFTYNPSMRLIMILRNPVSRAYSHWNMEFERGREKNSFEEAILNEDSRIRSARPLQSRNYSYVDRGYYTDQIRRMYSYFDKQQVLIIRNDELRESPDETMDKVFKFLEVPVLTSRLKKRIIHSIPYSKDITVEAKVFLEKKFRWSILELEDWLEVPRERSWISTFTG